MYEVTGDDPSTLWWNTEWNREGLGVITSLKIASAPVPAQFLIWAFEYVATSMGISSSSRNSELTAILTWKGEEVGTINIRSSTSGRNALIGAMSQANTTKTPEIDPVPSSLRAPCFDETVKITLTYGRHPIDENIVWQTAFKVLGQAAEAGLSTAANAIAAYGIKGCMWFLTAGYGPSMRYKHSREAMRTTIDRFVLDNKFQEMYVFVHVDDRLVANGALDLIKKHSVA